MSVTEKVEYRWGHTVGKDVPKDREVSLMRVAGGIRNGQWFELWTGSKQQARKIQAVLVSDFAGIDAPPAPSRRKPGAKRPKTTARITKRTSAVKR